MYFIQTQKYTFEGDYARIGLISLARPFQSALGGGWLDLNTISYVLTIVNMCPHSICCYCSRVSRGLILDVFNLKDFVFQNSESKCEYYRGNMNKVIVKKG